MHPYLFDWVVNGHHIRPPTYGILLALSFTTGYFCALRRSLKTGFSAKQIENLFLVLVASSLLGGRLFHVLFEDPSYYLAHPQRIFAVWEGGYTFYGAVLAGMLGVSVYAKYTRQSFLNLMDYAGEAVMCGLWLGRLGCFFAGCCWGKPTSLPWGVVFSHPHSFATNHTDPLHPTQLYEAIGGIFLYLLVRKIFSKRKYEGQVIFSTLIGYGILRFLIEFFRGDDYRGFIFGGWLSYSQFIALLVIPFALAGMVNFSRKPIARDSTS